MKVAERTVSSTDQQWQCSVFNVGGQWTLTRVDLDGAVEATKTTAGAEKQRGGA